MGKHGGKKKKSSGQKSSESNVKQRRGSEIIERVYDKDTAIFILMSQELKDDGNRLFQKRDYEGAMLNYDKAIKLLPSNHIDVAYLRSNMAACYMQLGISEYPRAIHECNLALEVSPRYSKALLKRARCYEALNKLDLARRDVGTVLQMEPNNLMAIEISERVEKTIERQGSRENEIPEDLVPLPEYLEPPPLAQTKAKKEKARKKKSRNVEEKVNDNLQENAEEKRVDSNAEEKAKEMKVDGNKKSRNVEEKVNGNLQENAEEKRVNSNAEKKAKEMKVGGNIEENVKLEKVNGNVEVSKGGNKRHEKKMKRKIIEKEVDVDVVLRKDDDQIEERKTEDKLVVEEEKITNVAEEEPRRTVKLVFGEDIRWAQIPLNCDVLKLREVIADRFPSSKAVLVKYMDQEGDLVTITSTEELRLAESSTEHGSVKLYIVEVKPHQDPLFKKIRFKDESLENLDKTYVIENGHAGNGKEVRTESACISDWIIQFAHLFKNHVGFDVEAYLDLHEVGMKLYSDAMEETITSEEAQDLFSGAADKFQEMAALALFNWGNVHMSKARKRVYLAEDTSKEPVLAQVKSSYDWAQTEYVNAGKRYEEALRIKPNFYEAVLALGQQQFEQAKLSWYYAIGTDADLESWPSSDVLQLYNRAEENMEKGTQMWEEEQQVNELSQPNKTEIQLQNMKLNNLFKHVSADEAAEQASKIRAQIHVLWGTMLYERSIMEYKLGLPVWHECLEVAVEKFELAGASPTDIAVMIKNHCSNDTASEGMGFNIDEIVQAWNEMYEAKKWQSTIPSFRLEPLLRRRVSKIYYALENA